MVIAVLLLLLALGATASSVSLWTVTVSNGTNSTVDIMMGGPTTRVYPLNGTLTILVDPYSDLAIRGFHVVDHEGNEVEAVVNGLPNPKSVSVSTSRPAYLIVDFAKWRAFVPGGVTVPYSVAIDVINRTVVTVKHAAIITVYSYVEPRVVGDYVYVLNRSKMRVGDVELYMVRVVAYDNLTLIGVGKANVTHLIPVGDPPDVEWGEMRVTVCGRSILVKGRGRPVTALVYGTPITIHSLPPNVSEFDIPSVKVEDTVVLDAEGNPITGNVTLELQGSGDMGGCIVAGRGPYRVNVIINGTLADVGTAYVDDDGRLVVRTGLIRVRAEVDFKWPNITLLYPSYAKQGEPIDVAVVHRGEIVTVVRTSASGTTIRISKADAMRRVCFTDPLGAPISGAVLYVEGIALRTSDDGCAWVLKGAQRGTLAYGGLKLTVDLQGSTALPVFTTWSALVLLGAASGLGAIAANLVTTIRRGR